MVRPPIANCQHLGALLHIYRNHFACSGRIRSASSSNSATVIKRYGGPGDLAIEERPTPVPTPGEVLIEIRAFGLNHAEIYMRKDAWGDVAEVTGIECVGTVKMDPGGRFKSGQKVFAIVGGMGRSRNGSYAEFVCAPASNVAAIDSDLPWEQLAAIPESYATAWAALHGILGNESSSAFLRESMPCSTLWETRRCSIRLPCCVVADAFAWSAFWAAAVQTLEPVFQIPSGTHLSVFASALVTGTPAFPIEEIPYQRILAKVADGTFKAKPARVFRFEETQQAHRLIESSEAGGKVVVVT